MDNQKLGATHIPEGVGKLFCKAAISFYTKGVSKLRGVSELRRENNKRTDRRTW
jgi:hypothetical protein